MRGARCAGLSNAEMGVVQLDRGRRRDIARRHAHCDMHQGTARASNRGRQSWLTVLRSRVAMREISMNLAHDGRAIAHGGRHALGRFGAYVADREHAGQAGFERIVNA